MTAIAWGLIDTDKTQEQMCLANPVRMKVTLYTISYGFQMESKNEPLKSQGRELVGFEKCDQWWKDSCYV